MIARAVLAILALVTPVLAAVPTGAQGFALPVSVEPLHISPVAAAGEAVRVTADVQLWGDPVVLMRLVAPVGVALLCPADAGASPALCAPLQDPVSGAWQLNYVLAPPQTGPVTLAADATFDDSWEAAAQGTPVTWTVIANGARDPFAGSPQLVIRSGSYASVVDVNPPTTTLATAPVAPSGTNEWWTTIPTLSLTATDDTGPAGSNAGVTRTPWSWTGNQATSGTGLNPTAPIEGQGTLAYSGVDGATPANEEPVHTALFKVDLTNPVVSIADLGDILAVVPAIEFVVTEANEGTTLCALDAGVSEACSSPWTPTLPVDGAYTVTVQHTDQAGRSGAASVQFVLDSLNPGIAITFPPVGAVLPSGTFTALFTVTDANLIPSSVDCSVDGGALVDCTSVGSHAVAAPTEGDHTLTVTASDAAGRTTTVPREFEVDLTPPVVDILGPSEGAILSVNAVPLSFTATDANLASVQCRADGGAFAACVSGQVFALAHGPHTVDVRATDLAGNAQTDSVAFQVDTTEPIVIIEFPTLGLVYGAPTLQALFTVADATEARCRLDADEGPCDSFSGHTLLGLSEGDHVLTVIARDSASPPHEEQATVAFEVDVTPPTVAFSGVADGAVFGVNAVTLLFSATDPNGNLAAVTCQLDTGAEEACAGSKSYSGLVDGPHAFTVSASDEVGHSTTETLDIVVDTLSPVVIIDDPDEGAVLDSRTVTIEFSASDATLNATLGTVTCQLDTGTPLNCKGVTSFTFPDVPDGSHQATVTATDGVPRSTAGTVAFEVDATDPVLGFLPVDQDGVIGTTSITIPFTAVDANLLSVTCTLVQLDGPDDRPPVDCTGSAATTGASSVTFAALSEGHYRVDGEALAVVGLPGLDDIAFEVDLSPPVPVIVSPPDGAFIGTAVMAPVLSIGGNNLVGATCQLDEGAAVACTGLIVLTGLAQGAHTFTFTATDLADHVATTSIGFTVDLTDPVVAITEPLQDAILGLDDVDVAFGYSDNFAVATVTCQLNTEVTFGCAGPEGSNLNTVPLEDLAETSHVFTVVAFDLAGRAGVATVLFEVDLHAPVLELAQVDPDGVVGATSVTLAFAATDVNLDIDDILCQFDDQPFVACTANDSHTFASLTEGEHTLTVQVSDLAGHVVFDRLDLVVDLTPPAVAFTGPAPDAILAASTADVDLVVTDLHLASASCRVDDRPSFDCTGATTVTFFDLPEGQHTAHVTALDLGDNVAAASLPFNVDLVAPLLTLAAPADGEVLTAPTVPFAFTVVEGYLVTLTCQLDEGPAADCDDLAGHTFDGVGDGHHTLTLAASDGAGRSSEASVAFIVDATAPLVAITGAPQDAEATEPVTVEADLFDLGGLVAVQWSVDGSLVREDSLGGVAIAATSATASFDRAGSHTFEVSATDVAGRTSTASASFEVGLPPQGTGASSSLDGTVTATETTPADESAESDATPPTETGTGVPSEAAAAAVPVSVVATAAETSSGAPSYAAVVHALPFQPITVSTPDSLYAVGLSVPAAGTLAVTIALAPPPAALPAIPYATVGSLDVGVHDSAGSDVVVESGTVRFAVLASALEAAGGDASAVAAFHWNGVFWERLPTTYIGRDGEYHRWSADAGGFSPFVFALTQTTALAPAVDRVVAELATTGERAQYTARVEVTEPAETVRVAASDGAFEIDLQPPEAGEYLLRAVATRTAPSGTPGEPTDFGRYFDVDLENAQGLLVEPHLAELRVRVVPADVAEHGGTAAQLIVAKANEEGWLPIPTTVDEDEDGYIVRAMLPSFSVYAVLLDTEAPQVGLAKPPPLVLEAPFTFDVVASDNVAVEAVAMLVGAVEVARDGDAPFAHALDPARLSSGEREVTFVAYDAAGNEARSVWKVVVPGTGAADEDLDQFSENGAPEGANVASNAEGGAGWLLPVLVIGALAAIGAAVFVLMRVRKGVRAAVPEPASPPSQ